MFSVLRCVLRRRACRWVGWLILGGWLAGCASSAPTDPRQIARRKAERAPAYSALTPEWQAAVDQGQVKVGMTEDAVYIAWGKPAQVLQEADATGETTLWLYHGTATDSFHSWRYREYPRRDGTTFLERTLDTDYAFREYVSAELKFRGGKLASWRTLPKPPERNYYAPSPAPY